MGRFVFLTADVSHAFIENLQNGPPQVEALCVYSEVLQQVVHVEGEACDIAEGVVEVAQVDHEEEVYEPAQGIYDAEEDDFEPEDDVEQEDYNEEEYIEENVYDEEDGYDEDDVYMDAEEVHIVNTVQDVTDNATTPTAENAATEAVPS